MGGYSSKAGRYSPEDHIEDREPDRVVLVLVLGQLRVMDPMELRRRKPRQEPTEAVESHVRMDEDIPDQGSNHEHDRERGLRRAVEIDDQPHRRSPHKCLPRRLQKMRSIQGRDVEILVA